MKRRSVMSYRTEQKIKEVANVIFKGVQLLGIFGILWLTICVVWSSSK